MTYELLLTAYGLSGIFWITAFLELVKSKYILGNVKYIWGAILLIIPAIGYFFFNPLLYLLLEWGYLKWSKPRVNSIVNQKIQDA